MKTVLQQTFRSLLATLLVFSLLMTVGCRGCFRSDSGTAKEGENQDGKGGEKPKPKPDFISRTPVLLPGYFPPKYDPEKEKEKEKMDRELRIALEEQSNAALRFNRHKLGHWVEAHLSVIANNFNADGKLQAVSVTPSLHKVPVFATDYFARTERPFTLTKGEWKNLEVAAYLPRRETNVPTAIVDYELSRGGGVPFISLAQGTPTMKPFQYHIVILSERPDNYNFLKLVDSVQLRGEQFVDFEDYQFRQFYYVVPTIFGEPIPLPRQSLFWTSIAYLIWDDIDPDRLGRDQQEALLDWLHFGGQLIVSGPDSLSKLQNSFLGNYLPAQFNGSRNLTGNDFAELNRNWSVPLSNRTNTSALEIKIADDSPILGLSFNPHQSAQYVDGTGGLLIERQVGRGRIVVTSFSLLAPAVRKWPSFQSLVNGALLRRPPREFTGRMNAIHVRWQDSQTGIFDPLIGSTLRYLSRDLGSVGTNDSSTYSPSNDVTDTNLRAGSFEYTGANHAGKRSLNHSQFQNYYGGYQDAEQSGVAGWNDDSGIANAARETLQLAAGIVPPSSAFVLKMLSIYLVVLVPLNWLVFRIIGRVEWAWIAAPFIAIVGAVMVVKLASLDIGFVRSNIQLGLLEVYADYPRAHVAEYSALYTSLSTNYDVELDNLTAQSLPFAGSTLPDSSNQRQRQLRGVTIHRTAVNRLEGLPIQSNSTGLLHTEFMLDLDGVISAKYDSVGIPQSITNGSLVNIQNAGILRRDNEGKLALAWIGELASNASAELSFLEVTESDYASPWLAVKGFGSSRRWANELWEKYFQGQGSTLIEGIAEIPEISQIWQRISLRLRAEAQTNGQFVTRESFVQAFCSMSMNDGLQIGSLFDAVRHLELNRGEVRLIGSTSQPLGRTKFVPEATRNERQTLVVVHLRRPPLPPAQRDKNSPREFMAVSDLDWEREANEAYDEEG